MKKLLLSIAILLTLMCSCPLRAQKPTGLMTDLVEHTDVSYGGRKAQILSTHPSFSWIVPGAGMQTSYRIILYQGTTAIWDSGTVESPQSTAVPYGGPALQPSTSYSWTVCVGTTDSPQAAWSDLKPFSTGASLSEYSTPGYPLTRDLEHPVEIGKAANGNILVDFGREAFGWVEMRLTSDFEGKAVVVYVGERVVDGNILRKASTTVRCQKHILLLDKGTHTYKVEVTPDKRNTLPGAILMPDYIGEVMPHRYCEIEGLDSALAEEDIWRWNVHYPFDMGAASFTCSDAILMRIWEMCRYSVQATSFTGIYIDGDRERIPYEADAIINQLCHYGADREFTMARRSLEYLLKYPTWPTEWILQSVMIAWNDYLFTGDARALAANYDVLKAHCLRDLRQENGLISTRKGQSSSLLMSINRKESIRDIVDWPQRVPEVDGVPGGSDGFVFTDYNAVVNAYWHESLILLSKIAEVLGKEYDAYSAAKEADALKEAFGKAFYRADQGCYADGVGTDHASLHTNLFALLFGLVPEDRQAAVADYVASRGMSCGVYAAQFLLQALYASGQSEAAMKLMTSTKVNSWYNMLKVGATITLEAWDDTFKPNQDWNHIWGAAPGNIIPFNMMGVMPVEPGFAKAVVKPQPSSLELAQLLLPTIRGSISMKIEQPRSAGSIRLSLTLPANMQAQVMLPLPYSVTSVREAHMDGVKVRFSLTPDGFVDFGTVSPGSHTFELRR